MSEQSSQVNVQSDVFDAIMWMSEMGSMFLHLCVYGRSISYYNIESTDSISDAAH